MDKKMKTREDTRRGKPFFSFLFLFPNGPFCACVKNKSTHSFFIFYFFMIGHSSWSTFSLHLRRGPEHFVNQLLFLKETAPWKLDHEVGPWKKTISHGPWCKPTLIGTANRARQVALSLPLSNDDANCFISMHHHGRGTVLWNGL